VEVLVPSLLFGSIVGFSLGLTGGGGSIFAVPLLVYGLAMPVHQAVGLSLAVVGATALGGALLRLRRGEVDVKLGLIFGLAGVVGAPVGASLGAGLPAKALLGGFAVLMVLVAVRMWRRAVSSPLEASAVRMEADIVGESAGPVCRVNPQGAMTLTSRCAVVLGLAGCATGFLSGLFGVGGGFLIVPALMLTTSMPIHRAVATSLLVIAIVSASGVAAYIVGGRALDPLITVAFVAGGLAGMTLGGALSRRLAGPQLQKVFAVAMIGVGGYMLLQEALFNSLW
jgi:uncharacterized membrane protein YfcA